MIIKFVLSALTGAVNLLQKDIESASNKVATLNNTAANASFKHEERVAYYNELIEEAHTEHAKFLAEKTKKVQALIIRRNVATRLKSAITNVTTGEIV